MNNKEFIAELSKRSGYSVKEASELLDSTISVMVKQLQEGNSVTIPGFGSFEVRKKMERISVNPTSKLRMLVPPKLVLSFKPSNVLKSKIK